VPRLRRQVLLSSSAAATPPAHQLTTTAAASCPGTSCDKAEHTASNTPGLAAAAPVADATTASSAPAAIARCTLPRLHRTMIRSALHPDACSSAAAECRRSA
jgi:hypothetical protein